MSRKYNPVEEGVCDRIDKKDYLCQYRRLNFFVRLRVEVTKPKRVIRNKQMPWKKL